MQLSVLSCLLCLVAVTCGQNMPVCQPMNYVDALPQPTGLQVSQFSVVIEANFEQENSTTNVREYFDAVGNRGRMEVIIDGFKTVGIFDYDDKEIFIISDRNDTCKVGLIADPLTPNLPSSGFIAGVNGSIHINSVRHFFQTHLNNNATLLGVETVRGIPCNRWQTCTVMGSNSYTLDYYFATRDWDFSLNTPVQVIFNALVVSDSVAKSLSHIYSFVSFDIGPRAVPDEIFTVPLGLICSGRTPGLPVPSLPEYFSATIEAVQKTTNSTLVYKEFYDFPKRLSRVDVYYDGNGRAGNKPGQLSIIRDSARNIEYIINRQLQNCTVVRRNFDVVYFYALEGTSKLVADLSNPPELLSYVPFFSYVYEGVTNVRGVPVDAWIGLISASPYEFTTPHLAGFLDVRNLTFEVFFTRPGWKITNDRTVIVEPTLWRLIVKAHSKYTNYTDNVTTSGEIYGVYDIIDYSAEEPDFDAFDISTCFSSSEYHILNLAIPGHELSLNFSQLRNNLRSAFVGYYKIQPLQVGNIQITGENGTHIFVSLHISDPTQLAKVENSKTADEILEMIQNNTVNGRLPFQISTGTAMHMVIPLLLNVNPEKCDPTNNTCFGLNTGQSAGVGIGLFILGLVCGVLGALLVLVVVKLCCLKTTTAPKKSSVNYEKQNDEVSVK